MSPYHLSENKFNILNSTNAIGGLVGTHMNTRYFGEKGSASVIFWKK